MQTCSDHFFDEAIIPTKPRKGKRSKRKNIITNDLKLETFYPMTDRQADFFGSFEENDHHLLHGVAGTGKTFLACYLAMKEIMEERSQQKLIIVRSTVPTRDMGFLPGNQAEKGAAYECPYTDIFSQLFNRHDAYEVLKKRKLVEFQTTSFIRGRTIDDAIIVVDEIANLNFQELDGVITRVGRNSKIIFAGDYRQSDFEKSREKEGLIKFMKVLRKLDDFGFIEFGEEDIVRSGLVKNYIIEKLDQGIHD